MEEAKGRMKQAAADLTDDSKLKAEGQAQENKATEERRSEQLRDEAKEHKANAEQYDEEQRMAENS
ncbi:MAG TPA: CsbD family protein [Mycobacteriales bacterium]|nr:CsbD family protein [Mycobacteriales bacterium]